MPSKKASPIKVFAKAIGHYPGLTLCLILVIVLDVVAALAPPLLLGKIVDSLTTTSAQLLLYSGLAYFASLLLAKLLEAVREGMITVWGEKLTHEIRSQMAAKLKKLPASYYAQEGSGSLVSRFVNDVDTLEDLFSSGIVNMIADLASVIGIVVVIFSKSVGLGILLLLFLPIVWLFTVKIQQKSYRAQLDNREAIADADRVLPETTANLLTIHLYRAQSFMKRHYEKILKRSFDAMQQSNFCDSVYSPVVIFIQAVLTGLMLLLASLGGPWQSFFGISAGTAVAIIAYVGQVFTPLSSIGMEIQNIQAAAAGSQRIANFLSAEERPEETESFGNNVKAERKNSLPAIEIKDLTFAYPNGKKIFDHFNLMIREGEKVTLKGRTGAGKSTLFKLILGLYAPQGGSIKILGQDVQTLPDNQKRQLYGCVEQTFQLIDGNLGEQISLRDPAISDQEIWQALETVGLADAVKKLPDGLNSRVTNATFSHGQMQLLTIARAISAKPRLLLFDEITANLDRETENRLLEALERASQGKTLLSISHRTELLKDGRIIEIKRNNYN